MPESRAAFQPWLEKVEASEDPLFFTVIDKASGKVAGRQTLMRIDPANGVIEIGNILWGPLIARKPAATEAQFLFMRNTSSTNSATAATSGSATTATSRRSAPPNVSASHSRASSAST